MTATIRSVAPAGPLFEEVCLLFDAYRVHYGEPAAATATRTWLGQQLERRRFGAYAALVDGEVAAFVTTAVIPASLTLRTAWLIRDLFVAPRYRRAGLARQLLRHVLDAARADRAFRVSLQTETTNTHALALYNSFGFQPVDGIEQLTLILE
ncbi:MAG: GNAT family N-acetyltransferase [Hamadaea sp.]|nr:GNAT family N-acetyltransferase [Hamadaea sp.]